MDGCVFMSMFVNMQTLKPHKSKNGSSFGHDHRGNIAISRSAFTSNIIFQSIISGDTDINPISALKKRIIAATVV